MVASSRTCGVSLYWFLWLVLTHTFQTRSRRASHSIWGCMLWWAQVQSSISPLWLIAWHPSISTYLITMQQYVFLCMFATNSTKATCRGLAHHTGILRMMIKNFHLKPPPVQPPLILLAITQTQISLLILAQNLLCTLLLQSLMSSWSWPLHWVGKDKNTRWWLTRSLKYLPSSAVTISRLLTFSPRRRLIGQMNARGLSVVQTWRWRQLALSMLLERWQCSRHMRWWCLTDRLHLSWQGLVKLGCLRCILGVVPLLITFTQTFAKSPSALSISLAASLLCIQVYK